MCVLQNFNSFHNINPLSEFNEFKALSRASQIPRKPVSIERRLES